MKENPRSIVLHWVKIRKNVQFKKATLFDSTVQNLKNRIICSLSVLFSPRLILTISPQISGQNKSEARDPEGLVKITYGIFASSFLKEQEIQIRNFF